MDEVEKVKEETVGVKLLLILDPKKRDIQQSSTATAGVLRLGLKRFSVELTQEEVEVIEERRMRMLWVGKVEE